MSQSLARVLLHIVFSTKHREPLIDPRIEDSLYRYLGSVCRSCGSPSLSIGGIEDHVHIACALGRDISIAELVQEVKVASSKWMKHNGVADFSWQNGYGAFSFGRRQVGLIEHYISHQREHHGQVTFCQEFRELLVRHNVPFDERYLWD